MYNVYLSYICIDRSQLPSGCRELLPLMADEPVRGSEGFIANQ
jgi:hypothetical protein